MTYNNNGSYQGHYLPVTPSWVLSIFFYYIVRIFILKRKSLQDFLEKVDTAITKTRKPKGS